MISAIELERCVVGAGIFGVVVDKIRHGKKPCSIILLEVGKGSEVSFYYTILLLYLVVCLRVKSGGKFLFDAEEIG